MCADSRTPLRVAVIDTPAQDDEPAIVRWHALAATQAGGVPGVTRLQWIGPHVNGARFTQGWNTLHLRGTSVSGLTTEDTRDVMMTAPGGMFVQTSPVPGDSAALTFGEVRWGGRLYHVFARGLTGHNDISDGTLLRMVIGVCLFGEAGATFLTPHGPRGCPTIAGLGPVRVCGVHVEPELGIYELEAIRRITAAVRDLLITLPTSVPIEIVLDVPRIQNWAYLLDGYGAGHVPHRLLLQWWRYTDRRREQTIRTLHNHVRTASRLAQRRDIRVIESPGLDPAEHVIRNAISLGWPACHGRNPQASLARAMTTAMLDSPYGQEWRILLDHHASPESLADLSLASYIWQLARPSLTASTRPVRTIMVDDISEHRLYIAAHKTVAGLAKHGSHSAVPPHVLSGIFPLRQVFMASQPGTRSLFHLKASRFRTTSGDLLTARELAAAVTHSWHDHRTFDPALSDLKGTIA